MCSRCFGTDVTCCKHFRATRNLARFLKWVLQTHGSFEPRHCVEDTIHATATPARHVVAEWVPDMRIYGHFHVTFTARHRYRSHHGVYKRKKTKTSEACTSKSLVFFYVRAHWPLQQNLALKQLPAPLKQSAASSFFEELEKRDHFFRHFSPSRISCLAFSSWFDAPKAAIVFCLLRRRSRCPLYHAVCAPINTCRHIRGMAARECGVSTVVGFLLYIIIGAKKREPESNDHHAPTECESTYRDEKNKTVRSMLRGI